MVIERPKFVTVPLAHGLKWRGGGGWRYEQKMDGVWGFESFYIGRDIFTAVGERMKGGEFYAFDIVQFAGEDCSQEPLSQRINLLDMACESSCTLFNRPAVGNGAEFLEAVLAHGGEGVVAKQLDAPFGAEWFKCKRIVTFDLLVTEKAMDGRSSIRVGELNGEDRGWCPCKATFDQVKVGDIVEIAAYSLTAKGKLREPRFVKIRYDKAV
jgi:ATP-dependent DNA ligase